jgi:predicted adenylyl cyclase CyaB
VPENIEIKARVRDLAALRERVVELADGEGLLLIQEDVFFHVPQGRLKLRRVGERGELIHYRRDASRGPKLSTYRIEPVANPRSMRCLLADALGERAVVAKRRWLYMIGRTRVHLDEVEDLGSFMELEVVLREGDDSAAGQRDAEDIMRALSIDEDQLLSEAYVDLLESTGERFHPLVLNSPSS